MFGIRDLFSMSHPVNDEILDRLREEGEALGYTGEVENIFGWILSTTRRRTMKENHKMKNSWEAMSKARTAKYRVKKTVMPIIKEIQA